MGNTAQSLCVRCVSDFRQIAWAIPHNDCATMRRQIFRQMKQKRSEYLMYSRAFCEYDEKFASDGVQSRQTLLCGITQKSAGILPYGKGFLGNMTENLHRLRAKPSGGLCAVLPCCLRQFRPACAS
ncbi:MAG: hypothetical protein ACLSFT_05485 [Ruminococcus callidus]